MKNLFFTFLALILLMPVAWAQCPTGDLDFMTQQQIDDFAVQYPNCTNLPGGIMISGNDIFDLRAFRNITSMGGSLLILNCTDLTHVTGFENLSSLSGSLIMTHNPSLIDLFGLSNLESVSGNFVITDNPVLRNCSLDFVCQRLNTSNTGSTQINNNGESCTSMDELTYPCLHPQSFPSCYGTYVQDVVLTSQAQLDQFQPNCSVLIGNLTIDGSDITDISGLRFMSGIEGALTIKNTSLTDLLHLREWNFIPLTNLVIENNPSLTMCGMGNICRYLQEGGMSTINNNGAGCASLADLTAVCNELGNCPLNYAIFTQADADNFAMLYPNCSILSGTLRVGHEYTPSSDVNDLSTLSTLTQVHGNLIIQNSSALTDLDYLQNVTTVIGDMFVRNNDNLQNIMGLQSLTSVGKDLRISSCDIITDLTGLENLTTVGRNFSISYNNALLNIDALQNLNNITGDLYIENGNLQNLNGLQNITTLGGLSLIDNNTLVNLNGLHNLTYIDGDFNIWRNDALTDLTALQNLTGVAGRLQLRKNAYTSLTGLENLTSIERLTIAQHPNLTDISSLSNITSTIEGLTISSNSMLSECSLGFICEYLEESGLSSVDYLHSNASGCESEDEVLENCFDVPPQCPDANITLTTQQQINAFAAMYPNCTEIPGLLQIGQSSGGLTDINNLSPLSFITSVGDISIERTQITNLTGLEGLQNVSGDMKIILNPNLNTINALSGMNYIEGLLQIGFNKELTDLAGLNQLTFLGSLRIVNNKKLTSLLALNNLETVSQIAIQDHPILASLEGLGTVNPAILNDLTLTSNAQLVTCALPNICEYLGNGGSNFIANNATGCFVVAEVQQNCNNQCPTGDVTLMTQQQVNNFAATYPACTEIQGLLSIGKTSGSLSNITNLSSLSQLESVGGISIQRTTIANLSGLEQLQTVTGDLRIILNPNLTNIHALSGITSVGGQVHLSFNKELVTLTGLNQLSSVGSLRINGNKKLANVSDLTNLQTAPELIIQDNQVLSSIDGLAGVNPFTLNNVTITTNPLLSDCAVSVVCQHLNNQGANLILNNATGCANTSEVEDACMLNPVCALGDIYLLNQQQVNDFATMHADCSVIDGNIFIGQTSGNLNDITDLSPLGFITQVEVIEIRRTRITDLSGLEQLQNTGNLVIELNPNLVNIHALSNLQFVENTLSIGFNRELLTLDGLEALGSVGELFIRKHKKLNSLEALSNLTDITILRIQGNDLLTNLTGLENMNPDNITFIELSLNPLLSACSIESICTNLLENDTDDYFIIQNTEGCNTQQEVLDNCIAPPPPPPSDSCDATIETSTFVFDNDLFIDGIGFGNNPNITFTDPATPASAVLSDITLQLFFRVNGTSCESDIEIQLTDPAGNVNVFSGIFASCNGSAGGLYSTTINIPSANTTGNMDDWLIEFDDNNDQNTDYEYSLRFARLTYTATTSEGLLVTNQVSDFADFDLFIDGTGFANNDTYTFTDPGTPADATLSDISLELYFKLNGSSCENEIAIQITDPAGNTQPLTAFTTCMGGTDLYFVNLDVPSGNTTGSPADWVVEFDDTNDQNASYEYSVRFGRLTYIAEYIECMEMLVNENNDNSQQLNNSSTHHPTNSTTHQLDNSLKLYPVPTSNLLNVEYFSENINATTIEIISNEGKTLMLQKKTLQEGMNTIQLDITDIPVGYYFIRMYGADDVQTQPFVKIMP